MTVKYVPHHAVTSHPVFATAKPGLDVVLIDQPLDKAIRCVQTWRRMEERGNIGKLFAPFLHAVIWDLKTHYGVTDEELKP